MLDRAIVGIVLVALLFGLTCLCMGDKRKMTDEEEQIAFKQWCKDWGDNFKGMPKSVLWQIYRSMDLENRKEFLEESKEKK